MRVMAIDSYEEGRQAFLYSHFAQNNMHPRLWRPDIEWLRYSPDPEDNFHPKDNVKEIDV